MSANLVYWALHIPDHKVINLKLENKRWKKGGRWKDELKSVIQFLWETLHQKPIQILQFSDTTPWGQEHLGVRGKSIATARQPSQKPTSVLQEKCYRPVKGKHLVWQTLKHRTTSSPFISLWIMWFFYDSEEQEKSGLFVANLMLVIFCRDLKILPGQK